MEVDFTVAEASEAPIITQNVALDDSMDLWGVESNQTGGIMHWARYDTGEADPPQTAKEAGLARSCKVTL